jgi:hypothetical protein
MSLPAVAGLEQSRVWNPDAGLGRPGTLRASCGSNERFRLSGTRTGLLRVKSDASGACCLDEIAYR